jgi:chromosomal replication initiation ATPase DnaA
MSLDIISKNISLDLIAQSIADYYQIEPIKIFTRSRETNLIKLRCLYVGLANYYNATISPNRVLFSCKVIGSYCYSKYQIQQFDHSTVLNSKKRFFDFFDTDKSFNYDFFKIIENCDLLSEQEHNLFNLKKDMLLRWIEAATCEADLKIILSN